MTDKQVALSLGIGTGTLAHVVALMIAGGPFSWPLFAALSIGNGLFNVFVVQVLSAGRQRFNT